MAGKIFKKARMEIQNPATLQRLMVDLIGAEQWTRMDSDMKGDIYEGLLARSAAESPKGAGQFFVLRELIKAFVDVIRPTPEDTVCDQPRAPAGCCWRPTSTSWTTSARTWTRLRRSTSRRASFGPGNWSRPRHA